MTEQERVSRETLLRRAAAVAGASYVAPALTSSAAAEAQVCAGQKCRAGKKGKKTCKKAGGKSCTCVGGRCAGGGAGPCINCGPQGIECGPETPCGGCFNGQCVVDATSPGSCNSGSRPGTCIDLRDGLCASFQPCGRDKSCPAGQCCFSSCCDCVHVFPPLCSDTCGSARSPWAGTPLAVGKGPLAVLV
jgi:hypothetical protein